MSDVLRHQVEVIKEFPGSEIVGKAYQPLFSDAIDRGDSDTAWTVVSADFVGYRYAGIIDSAATICNGSQAILYVCYFLNLTNENIFFTV